MMSLDDERAVSDDGKDRREKKERSDVEDGDVEARPAKKRPTTTAARHEELTIMEDMIRENRTAAYQNTPSASVNFEHLINEFWKKGICECCEGAHASMVACRHRKSDRVHEYCSYLCQECKHFKEEDEPCRRVCPFCFTQNVKGGACL